jgi:hypothetical protein
MKNWLYILFLIFGISENAKSTDPVFQEIEKEGLTFITSTSDYGYLGGATRNEHSNLTTPLLENRVSSYRLKQLNFNFHYAVPVTFDFIYFFSNRKPFICIEKRKTTTSSSLYKLFNNYRL